MLRASTIRWFLFPPRSPRVIRRVPAVWGTAERIEGLPGLTIRERALYRPADGARPHGLAPAAEGDAPPEEVETAPDGFYLVLDVMTGHYGHFIADVLARLWPVLDRPPETVRIVCEPGHGRAFWEAHPFMREILAGLDLTTAAVVSFDRPVVLPRAAIPEPGLHNLRSVHPVFGDLCRRAGRRYWCEAEVDTVTRPAYLAKTRVKAGVQHLANEGAIVAALERLGADILFPEAMSFAEQVREFARRRVVMGPTGSAFHTAAFSAPARRIVGLSGLAQLNSNHLLFDALNGSRTHYYYVPGTSYGSQEGFGLVWTVPDPEAVAARMMARAEDFDRIDAFDAADELAEARRWHSLPGRLGRLRGRIAARLPDLGRDQDDRRS